MSEIKLGTGGATLSGSGANLVSTSPLDLSGNWVDAPAGTIIQYVEVAQSVISPRFSTSSTSYTATNYLVDFTCKKSNSLVVIQGALSNSTQNANNGYAYFRCYQDGTATDLYEAGNGSGTSDGDWYQTPFKYVFTPGDTSSHQYKIYARAYSSSTTLSCGWSASAGGTRNWNHMCAMEVAQ